MSSVIAAFEVHPHDDEAFLAAWERARGSEAGTLHRALREDVDFRFVELARAETGGELPYRTHAAVYEIAHEERTPDVDGGVLLIDPFEVPQDGDERFVAGWDRARAALAQQRGYLGTRLHRSIAPADFRYVGVTRWSSPLMFARALARPELAQAAQAMPFRSHPALYQPVALSGAVT